MLIESAAIAEYLCDYYGAWLVPPRYPPGQDGQIGAETESWLRYRTFMHYAEGSLMPLNLVALIAGCKTSSSIHCLPNDQTDVCAAIKNSSVPFFIRPVTNNIADRITDTLLRPNFKTHYEFLESQLETSPEAGEYLCGGAFSAADILMSFPLEAGRTRSGMSAEQYPRVWKYLSQLQEREAYKRAVHKIETVEGTFKTNL